MRTILIIVSASVIVIMVVLAFYGAWRTRRAERLHPPVGRYVEVEGAKLHYVRKGSGATVLLLHGSDGFLEDFPSDLVESLSQRFDVIALDRPGHGYSDGPVGEAALPVTQVRLILGALQVLGVESAILVGHSWGALLAMIAAIEKPQAISGLVLLAPWIYPPSSPPPLSLSILRIPLVGSICASCVIPVIKSAIIRANVRRAFFPDVPPPAFMERAVHLWLRRPRQIRVFALESIFDRRELRRFSPDYPNLRAPVVVIVGDQDQIVPTVEHAERLRAARPATDLIVLQNTGHEIPHTRQAEVEQAVIACSAMAELDAARTQHFHVQPRDLARILVYKYGWNASAYQILNPHIELWFTSARDGVVGFVRRYGFRIVAGAPVCAEIRLHNTIIEFETSAGNMGERVCYFGAAARMQAALMHEPGHCQLEIGAQPVWNPAGWSTIIGRTSSLRAQLNRAKNKGVHVHEWSREEVESSDALAQCLSEWLAAKPLPTLQFLTRPVDLTDIQDRRIFVAETPDAVVGYLAATPVPDRDGWLVEQIVRATRAPNGVAELLVDAVMHALVEEGYTYVTLGLSPLSHTSHPLPTSAHGGTMAGLVLRWVRAHGRRFYNFDGLEMFKAKFRPDAWEPITVISNEQVMSLQALHAVAAAFSAGPPIGAILRAMTMAVKQEIEWFLGGTGGREDAGTGRQ